MIKALFLDIDGTLVSFETHRVGSPTRNALAEARRRNAEKYGDEYVEVTDDDLK